MKQEKELKENLSNSFSEEQFLKFKEKYSSFSTADLEAILKDQRFTKEARKACEELLGERDLKK